MAGGVTWLTGALRRAFPPAEAVSLTAGPLVMAPPRHADYGAWRVMAAASRARLERWQPTWPEGYLSEASYDRRVALHAAQAAAGSGFAWHLWEGEVLVGTCRLAPIRRGAAMTGTLGYWVGEGHEGRGLATLAARAACGHAFGTLGLRRIEASYLVGNDASARVLAKAGFAREGVASASLEVAGARRDHVLVARIAS